MASVGRRVGVMLLLAAVYFLTARLGLLLAMPGGLVTPVWPPSGIALAAMLIFGRKIWPGIWLGSFAANLWGFLHTPGEASAVAAVVTAAGIGAGGVVTAWIGAELLRRWAGRENPIEHLRGVLALLGLGGVVACMFSASNGVLWLSVGGREPWSAAGSVWLTWWMGDTAGVFLFAPLLLAWCVPPSFPVRARAWEIGVCFAVLMAVGYGVFASHQATTFSGKPFTFVIIPFLVWPALRFGQRGAATAALATTCLAVWGTIHGLGPFDSPSRDESLLDLELFLSVVSLTALCIGALAAAQRRAEIERHRVLDELESRVAARTADLRANEQRLRTIIDAEPECVKVVSTEGCVLDMNAAGLAMLDAASLEELNTRPLLDYILSEYQPAFGSLHRQVIAGGSGTLEFETIGLKGTRRFMETHAVPLRDVEGRVTALLGITRDITARKRDDALLRGQKQVLEMIASGVPLAETLAALLRIIEAQSSEMLCSLLLLDPDGVHVRQGASPSLPEAFSRAIDGLPIGPSAGSCGTAAFRGEAVIVEDIANDPLWAAYRELALAHGLRACWSTPIFDAQRRVLGTFAIYYREPGAPTALHLRCIDLATGLAAIAISRTLADTALRDAETRLRLAVAASNVGLWDWNLARSEIYFSREWKSQIGYAEDEIPDRFGEWESRVHPDDLAPTVAKMQGFLDDPTREYATEFRLRHKDGSWRWILTQAQIFRDEVGTPARMLGCHIDITARKRAEENLRESEGRFRLLTELISDFAYALSISPDGTPKGEWLTDAFTRSFGYSIEGIEARGGLFSIVDPADLPVVHAHYQRVLSGSADVCEMRFITQQGESRWLRDYARPVWDEAEQRVTRIFGAAQDITERKRAEEALRESEQRLRGILDTMFVFVGLMNLDGEIVEVNQAPLAIAGLKRDDVLGRTVAESFWFSHSPAIQEQLRRAIVRAAQGEVVRDDYLIRVEGGKHLTIDTTFAPLRDASGSVTQIVGSAVDVTERKRAEAALRESHEQLRALAGRLQAVREEEAARIARELHDELGGALTTLKLDVAWMSRRAAGGGASIEERAVATMALIDSTIQSVRRICLELRPAVLDQLGLATAIHWLAKDFERRTSVVCTIETTENVSIEPERAVALFRITQEVLTNVARHAQAGEVRISLAERSGQIVLEVGDDGGGFDESALCTRMGLGLAGMRERAASAGGTLAIVSAPGRGTEVRVTVPAGDVHGLGYISEEDR